MHEKELNPNLFDTIKRYPFNGRSKYLIDRFYIIGYEYNTIHKLFIESQIKDLIKEEPILNNSDFNDLVGGKKIQKDEFKKITIPNNPPSLLNEIASDYQKQMPDFDVIRNMIFPNGCDFYYSNEICNEDSYKNLKEIEYYRTTVMKSDLSNDTKKKNKKKKLPNSYNVVFSYNPQEGNNSKKSINGFSFIFYKRHNESKISEDKMYYFYVPYTFCIISEYPFYNSYYMLCNQLYNLIKKKIEIPIEIIIYNIVNYTMSPLNSDVFLNLDSFNLSSSFLNSELVEIKEEAELELEQEEDNIKSINENENEIEKDKEKEKIVFADVDKKNNNIKYNSYKHLRAESHQILVTTNNKLNLEENFGKKRVGGNIKEVCKRIPSSSSLISSLNRSKPFEKIKFGLLSGYPLIQYNLVKVLLNKMSPADVITIFFYTFLEKSVIFFSKNIELLSLTIDSYLNLNFPLNDEKYYFFNASISYDNYMEGNSIFIGTTFTNVIGINNKYTKNYKNNHVRLAEHLTVDLDKGVINQVEDERENDNEERDNHIFDFFKQIFKNKEMKEEDKNTILYKEVKNIFEKLSFYKELFNKKNPKDKMDEYKKVVNGNYIDYDDHEESAVEGKNDKAKYTIKYINRDIQESFYILINNLCIYFYQNLSLRSYEDIKNKVENDKKDSMNVIFNDNFKHKDYHNNYIQEEIDFLEELRETMKFQSFVYGFIQSYNPIDLYKIPLTFTEEFLSMLTSKSNIYNENKNYVKFLSLIDSIYKKFKKKTIYIDFNQFVIEYYKKYKDFFYREIYDNHESDKMNVILKDDINQNITFDGLKYLSYELNNNIIFQYKNILDNLDENEFHSLLNIEDDIEDNKIQNILLNDIENSIEKQLMDKGLLTSNDICCSNIIILFIISMKSIIMKFDFHLFFSSLFQQCKVFRKYYTMIIEILYKLLNNSLENKKYQEAEDYLMSYYPIINSLRSLGLVPNENLINIIKKFHQINIDELHNYESNNKIEEKKDEKDEKDEIKIDKNVENNVINEHEKDEIDEKNNEKKKVYEEIEFDDNFNFIYICKNFTRDKIYKEDKILKKVNELNNKNKNSTFILGKKNGKILKPKVKFSNGRIKYEFDIYSQMKIFDILSSEYIIYISSNLDNNFLNAEELFPICLNIILYFKNMKNFEGKDEINVALIEMLQLYFNLYQNLNINNQIK